MARHPVSSNPARSLRPRRPAAILLALAWLLLALPAEAWAQEGLSWCEAHYSTAGGASLGTRDLPWEVTSPRGESYLPDVFYAEPIQTRQVMPTALTLDASKGEGTLTYQIRDLIYPTLGNPNLVMRQDPEDALLTVLRLPEGVVTGMGPHRAMEGTDLRILSPEGGALTGMRLSLVARGARSYAEANAPLPAEAGIYPINPSCVMLKPLSGKIPAELQARATLILAFDGPALAGIPPGLYDLRLDQGGRGDGAPSFELAYNAVRIFDDPLGSLYHVLNVTDSQASVSDNLDGVPGQVSFRTLSERRLAAFVEDIRTREDPQVRNAAFITFNGDLHNGGSPGTLFPETVALTYLRESQAIVTLLRDLPVPIFLTAGNHDGYASTGSAPDPIRRITEPKRFIGRLIARIKRLRSPLTALGRTWPLKRVLRHVDTESWWPEFDRKAYLDDYLPSIRETPGGWARDLFTGVFARLDGPMLQRWEGWRRVPDAELNVALYDGFNQWRRAYGPLYFSHIFGDTHFISLNTFDLRQHRRSGWGMYSVNYGGGISPIQSAWLNKQLGRSQTRGMDVVLLAHHDPRGGHTGEDFPYYFEQVDYQGISDSISDYVRGEVVAPVLCDAVSTFPEGLLPASLINRCLHDGLQEWMRPDPMFDCAYADRDPATGRCRPELFTLEGDARRHPVFSGFQAIDQLARQRSVRTLLLGHTHYNSVEILQPGDAIVPGALVFDRETALAYVNQPQTTQTELTLAELEILNPIRRKQRGPPTEPEALVREAREARVLLDLAAAGHSFERVRQGEELVILRMTTVADLTTQIIDGMAMSGYGILGFGGAEAGTRRLSTVGYFQWSTLTQGYRSLGTLDLDRDARWASEGFETHLARAKRAAREAE